MSDLSDEIQTLELLIDQLKEWRDPATVAGMISQHEKRLVKLRARVAFVPYRNSDGVLVLNELGDTEEDL